MTKINLRKSTNFIAKVFKQDLKDMNDNERGPQAEQRRNAHDCDLVAVETG